MSVSAKTKSTSGFVSDQDLTEKEFIDKYRPIGTLTEEYLKARYRWLTMKPGDNREQVTNAMHDAYEKTEAFQKFKQRT